MNSSGADDLHARVMPAQEGFDAETLVATERDVGLVVQHELVALEGPAEVGDEREPAHAESVVLGAVARCGRPDRSASASAMFARLSSVSASAP